MSDDDPITRAELERALRGVNATSLHNRDALIQLAAHVMALTDALGMSAAVEEKLRETLEQIRIADLGGTRVALDAGDDRTTADVPCEELIPLCGARCCSFSFALSTEDLDAGVVRWDYGRPYMIKQRADGYCTHNNPTTHGCAVHAHRPRVCRSYDCRDDPRVWIDYEKRIPRPLEAIAELELPPRAIDLKDRLRRRMDAVERERAANDTKR